MPMQCCECENYQMVDAEVEERLTVAGRAFVVVVPGTECLQCGNTYLRYDAMIAVKRSVAMELVRHGDVNAETFKYMRKTIPMSVAELAPLLHVAPETVSRWESGEQPIEPNAAALLALMVVEAIEGRSTCIDHLKATLDPISWPEVTRLAPDVSVIAADAAPKDLPAGFDGHFPLEPAVQDSAAKRREQGATVAKPRVDQRLGLEAAFA